MKLLSEPKHKLFLSLLLVICSISVILILVILENVRFSPSKLPSKVQPPAHPELSLQTITGDTAKDLDIIFEFREEEDVPIYGLSLTENNCCVMAIHKNGYLVRWNLRDIQITKYRLDVASQNSINFSADGNRLLTPSRITDNDEIIEINVWDTNTGESLFCDGNSEKCPEGYHWDRAPQVGYFLNSSGELLFSYTLMDIDNYAFSLSDYEVQNVDDVLEIPYGDIIRMSDKYFSDPNAEVALMTMDVNSEYLVFALHNGMVRIEESIPFRSEDNYFFIRNLIDGLETKSVEIVDLKIDNTRTWLAVLREDKLLVWNLQRGYFTPLKINDSIFDGNAIAFDQAGQLLAVGTDSNIVIYDLKRGKVVNTLSVENTTALIFSRDNQMLISGDSTGHLYIFGVQ